MDPSDKSQIQLFELRFEMCKALVHIICDGRSRSFPFTGLQMGVDQDIGRRSCDWLTVEDRLMGKLLPGCLADTRKPH